MINYIIVRLTRNITTNKINTTIKLTSKQSNKIDVNN